MVGVRGGGVYLLGMCVEVFFIVMGVCMCVLWVCVFVSVVFLCVFVCVVFVWCVHVVCLRV